MLKYAPDERKLQRAQNTDDPDKLIESLEKGLEAFTEITSQYISLVKSRVEKHLTPGIDNDDMFEEGFLALQRKAADYDTNRGAKFVNHAINRIDGALLDFRRETFGRNHRDYPKIERVIQEILARTGTNPTDRELAESAHLSLKIVQNIRNSRPVVLVSLEDILRDEEKDEEKSDHVEELGGIEKGFERLEKIEDFPQLVLAVEQLPSRLQQVLNYYYIDELKLWEIGKKMELSEPRVCQLHAKAILRLRKILVPENRNGSSPPSPSNISVTLPSG